MCDNICTIIVCVLLGIGLIWIIVCGKEGYDKRKAQKDAAIITKVTRIEDYELSFNNIIKSSFLDTGNFSMKVELFESNKIKLKKILDEIITENKNLMSLTYNNSNYDVEINILKEDLAIFEDYIDNIKKINIPKMIDVDKFGYGKNNAILLNGVKSLNSLKVDNIVEQYEEWLETYDIKTITKIDMISLNKCLWFYALSKPFSSEKFNIVKKIIPAIYYNTLDIDIAEYYAIKQMGADDILISKVREKNKLLNNKEDMTELASAFMWMKSSKAEIIVLENMVEKGIQLNGKMQERLFLLSNGGDKMPDLYDVVSKKNLLYFDISSISWNESEYVAFFENLIFQEKKLPYSLAIREEEKDLFITSDFTIPNLEKLLEKAKNVFKEEYGEKVTLIHQNCMAISGSGEEEMDTLLAISKDCNHMGIIVYVVKIGKKIDIKFYTLFMPTDTDISKQKQKALSLYNKISPSTTSWESSLKEMFLMVIEQLINSEPKKYSKFDSSEDTNETPLF